MLLYIKRIRKLTTKSRIETIKKYIKWAAERGDDFTEINLNDSFNKKFVDEYVINYLKSKGFKIFKDDKSITISWKE